jgi:hypothetical protein
MAAFLACMTTIAMSIVTYAVIAVLSNLAPVDAFAYSVDPPHECKVISFPPNSAHLSDALKVELARSLPRIRSLQLSSLIITAWGDETTYKHDASRQRLLAKRRAENIKRFYIDAGIDERSVFFNPRVAERKVIAQTATFAPDGTRSDKLKLMAGIAAIEYVGMCREGFQKFCAEMRSYCDV